MEFSQILEYLMSKDGLTNYQLAKDLDVHPTTVANWLNGKEPRKKTLMQLAEYFNVSIDYLMGVKEKEKLVTDSGDEPNDVIKETLEIANQLSCELQQVLLENAKALSRLKE